MAQITDNRKIPQTLASTVLIKGQTREHRRPCMANLCHLVSPTPEAQLKYKAENPTAVILGLEVISQEPSNGHAFLRGDEV